MPLTRIKYLFDDWSVCIHSQLIRNSSRCFLDRFLRWAWCDTRPTASHSSWQQNWFENERCSELSLCVNRNKWPNRENIFKYWYKRTLITYSKGQFLFLVIGALDESIEFCAGGNTEEVLADLLKSNLNVRQKGLVPEHDYFKSAFFWVYIKADNLVNIKCTGN